MKETPLGPEFLEPAIVAVARGADRPGQLPVYASWEEFATIIMRTAGRA